MSFSTPPWIHTHMAKWRYLTHRIYLIVVSPYILLVMQSNFNNLISRYKIQANSALKVIELFGEIPISETVNYGNWNLTNDHILLVVIIQINNFSKCSHPGVTANGHFKCTEGSEFVFGCNSVVLGAKVKCELWVSF